MGPCHALLGPPLAATVITSSTAATSAPPWSSLGEWQRPPSLPWLDAGPVPRCADWLRYVNEAQREAELARLQQSVCKGAPFGSPGWVTQTAAALGLEFSLRSPGRPPGRGPRRVGDEPGLFG